jgi:hypothetical protein
MWRLLVINLLVLTACTTANPDQPTDPNISEIQGQPIVRVAGVERKFDLLYKTLKEGHEDYITDVMKTLAFLILAIGWFVTSDKSREFFRKTIGVRLASIAALALLAGIHVWYCCDARASSQQTMVLLQKLNYLPPEYYARYEITSMHLATNLAQNAILFVVLIVILLLMKKPADSQ